jgi:hypothetical protein
MCDMLKELRQRSQKRKKLLAQTVSCSITHVYTMEMYLFIICKRRNCLCSQLIEHHAKKTWGVKVKRQHSWPWQWMEVSDQFHAPVTLAPGKELVVPIDRRLSVSQILYGRCGEISLAPAENRTLNTQLVACHCAQLMLVLKFRSFSIHTVRTLC